MTQAMQTAQRTQTRLSFPAGSAFWLIAFVYGAFLFAASAPSPLYVVYQAEWHFSAITLTVVFAVYVLALLLALVLAGSISDRIGRRPTVLAAGSVQAAAMVVFAVAPGIAWLGAARVLQGLATGLVTGALSAWLLDLQPEGHPRRGTTVSSTAASAGLALGAIGAGLLVQYAPAPTHLVYWLLAAAFAAGTVSTAAVPETVTADEVWWRALRPRIGVAPQARGAFAAVAPCLVAVWALSGLFLSLGGSLTAGLLHSRSHVVGGLVVLALGGAGTVATLLTTRVAPRFAMIAGCLALVLGVTALLVAIHHGSTGLFFAGAVIAGAGFGPAFTGAFRTVIEAAPPTERAALVAAVFVASYLAFSLPAIAAGIAITHIGLLRTTTWYGVGVIALTIVAIAATAVRRTAATSGRPVACASCPGTAAMQVAAD